jgi:hypothetical protein
MPNDLYQIGGVYQRIRPGARPLHVPNDVELILRKGRPLKSAISATHNR